LNNESNRGTTYTARPLWGQGLVPPMGGFFKAAPLGCGFFTYARRPKFAVGY